MDDPQSSLEGHPEAELPLVFESSHIPEEPSTPVSVERTGRKTVEDYARIISNLKRRSANLSTNSAANIAFEDPSPTTLPINHLDPSIGREGDAVYDENLAGLEADLKLSAEIGQALLEEQKVLQERVATADAANQHLLDRLATLVRENAVIERRLEQAALNLEAADSSNRTLLVSLQDERKSINRLSAQVAKHAAVETKLKQIVAEREDLKQELGQETKRANAAEWRAKKAGERTDDLEKKLSRALEELEEVRAQKTSSSEEAVARAKARLRLTRTTSDASNLADNPEATELFQLLETVLTENESLRHSSLELEELLTHARDEQSGLQSEIDSRRAFTNGEGDDPDQTASTSLLSEVLMSPFERPTSPTFTNATSSLARSWAPSSQFGLGMGFPGVKGRKPSVDASSEGGAHAVSDLGPRSSEMSAKEQHTHYHYHLGDGKVGGLRSAKRRRGVMRMPFQGGGSRSLSVDMGVGLRDQFDPPRSAPASPLATTTFDLKEQGPQEENAEGSPDEDDEVRDSNGVTSISPHDGSPANQTTPAADTAAFAKFPHIHRDGTQSISPSGLSLSSPTRANLLPLEVEDSVLISTQDISTQTDPELSKSVTPTPSYSFRSTMSEHSDDLSERDRQAFESGLPPGVDTRTAALGVLIDYANKLLVRLRSSDVGSLERRLRKQNLPPGDVQHLAQSAVKDILYDVDNLRNHFRRVLDSERAALAREGLSSHLENLSDSLVTRREFATLLRLIRELLQEIGRLRALVNRVQFEPALASKLRELDGATDEGATATIVKPTPSTPGLLAPITRLFIGGSSTPPSNGEGSSSPRRVPSRPIPKQTGSSALSSTEVTVEFGAGVVRRAVSAVQLDSSSRQQTDNGEAVRGVPSRPQLSGPKSDSKSRRDLRSIFAGGLKPPRATADPWVVVPRNTSSRANTSQVPELEPHRNRTTEAVLDSIQHNQQPSANGNEDFKETLLNRTLRRRGLSDSSIRSTYLAQSNPVNRLITPAGLALSGELSDSIGVGVASYRPQRGGTDARTEVLKHLSETIRSYTTGPTTAAPEQPPAKDDPARSATLPIPVGRSGTKTTSEGSPMGSSIHGSVGNDNVLGSSLLGNISNWASKAAVGIGEGPQHDYVHDASGGVPVGAFGSIAARAGHFGPRGRWDSS